MHNFLTLLFLHVISKYVQTQLKQYIWHMFKKVFVSILFDFSNHVFWQNKLIFMRCILIEAVAVFWNYLFNTNWIEKW